MEISKELKCDIELSQNQLKCAIRNHQVSFRTLLILLHVTFVISFHQRIILSR